MKRRRFFKVSVVSVITSSPLLAACGGEIPAAAPLAAPAVEAFSLAGKTVAEYLIKFAEEVGIEILASEVADWLKGLAGQQGKAAREARDDMQKMDFVNYVTKVYNFNNSVIFFGMSKKQGPDTCVSFMAKRAISLVEGPALMGIALSGLSWDAKNVASPAALLPIKAHQTEISTFENSSSQPFRYTTPAGEMFVSYTANPAANEGKIRVQSVVDNLAIHDKTYGISWK